jgi:ribosomal protein L11 methylase PrmA
LTEADVTSAALEPGSFRDPDSRVVSANGRILRLLSERGLAEWRAFSASPLFTTLVEEGKLVGTREAADAPALTGLHDGVAGVLEHDVVPFVSYPYEWSFGMLRDAALLQLELVRRSVEAGLMLKDSTPYNVQFRGARPVFVDVGSFEPLREGEPWAGYRQFCMLFLYPLLLEAWKGVPFQPWLRGSIDGIMPQELRSLLSARDRFRRGALTHVVLHARLERSYEERDTDLKRELKAAGFRKELILANVKKLEKLVGGLTRRGGESAWSGYGPTTTYSDEDAERKARFVAEAVAAERPRVVWDLGSNDGRHARIAAETAEHVVAVDADEVVVDRLYEALKAEGSGTILPLTMNLADPSPGLGWRGLERRSLGARGTPDLALCLALVHHLSISGNVPVVEVVDWLRSLGAALVVEFPTPDDPMVARLLRRKREHDHPDYRRDWFERCLGERFDVARTEELASGTRVLYLAHPRS